MQKRTQARIDQSSSLITMADIQPLQRLRPVTNADTSDILPINGDTTPAGIHLVYSPDPYVGSGVGGRATRDHGLVGSAHVRGRSYADQSMLLVANTKFTNGSATKNKITGTTEEFA